MWRLHRHIGMGGDQFVAAVAGDDVERATTATSCATRTATSSSRMRDECEPLEGAAELLRELKRAACTVVLASSSSEDDLEFFVGKLDGRGLHRRAGRARTTSSARSRTRTRSRRRSRRRARDYAVMVGDSRWDIEAAAKAGLETICVITGGWSEQELAITAPPRSSSRCRTSSSISTRRRSAEPGYHVAGTVAVAQLVEPRVVVPVVAGSSPVRHPSVS